MCQLVLQYLRKSPSSPFKKVSSIFARNEYQAKAGNLSHIHLILQVDYENLSAPEQKFVDDLCRCAVLDIVRPDEIDKLIEDGTFESLDDWEEMIHDG